MRVIYSWLCDYLENPPAAEDIIAKLNRIGLKVESTEKTGADFTGVVVARIEKIEAHPNADKLHLVTVNDGCSTQRLVCGAQNIAEGQIVPLAKLGAKLPMGTLKKAKIRGVESEGMLCSCSELGVAGDPSGIMLLPKETPLGTDVLTLFPKCDIAMEVEILPNQGYALSHYAIARELSLFYGLKLKEPQTNINTSDSQSVSVHISDSNMCNRYTAIVVKNAGSAKTPAWLADRLSAIGVNPKGNILVDGSNYVMFETGQPLHCFDLAKISGAKINVRCANTGEVLTALDKKEYKLSAENLVIADENKPMAIAGVMGGFESSVSESTKDIVIEAACFYPPSVRKTSKQLNLKSDSSYRFERGTDIEITLKAASRFASLILEASPNAKIVQVADIYPKHYEAPVVNVSSKKLNALLGTNLGNEEIYNCLKAFQPSLQACNGEWLFTPPSYRPDLISNCDIAEELARFIGYDNIPVRSNMPIVKSEITPVYAVADEMRKAFAALGFNETYSHGFLSAAEAKICGVEPENCLKVINPLSSDLQYLRPSLLIGALRTLRYNLNRGQEAANIFETGTVYHADGSEEMHLSGLMYGAFSESSWRGSFQKADFYSIKGVLVSLLRSKAGFRFEKPRNIPAYYRTGACLEIKLGKDSLGYVGQLSSASCAGMEIKDSNVFYFELSLAVLANTWKSEFWQKVSKVKPVSSFPNSWRDLSFLIDQKYEWNIIEKAFSGINDLHTVKLIDVFKGKNVPEGQKSLTVRFIFSSMDKTLKDEEVTERMKEVMSKLTQKFNAKLRE